jgi:cobalt-zinc-cadmium efflux system protein
MHSHHHHHGHHSHHHAHGERLEGLDSRSQSNIAWAFFLNLGFALVEFVGGLVFSSTAILADAVHDLGDSLAIGMAWWLEKLGSRRADQSFTYGYKRFSLLGALCNTLILTGASIWVILQAVERLQDPVMPDATGMLGLALLGIAVNGYAAWRLSRGKTLNERTLNWHLLEDVLGWVAILILAVVLHFLPWAILDPILSLVFTGFILMNVLRLLRETLRVFFQGVPDAQLRQAISERLENLAGVREVHHLHFWSLDGERHVLTAHLLLDCAMSAAEQAKLKSVIADQLSEYHLAHTTIELELPGEICRDGGISTAENSRLATPARPGSPVPAERHPTGR